MPMHGTPPMVPPNQGPPSPATSRPRVLLVVLRDLSAMVVLEALHLIFSQFGVVEKMSTFIQDGQNQMVVQFELGEQARNAKNYLNGKTVTLRTHGGPVGDGVNFTTCSLAIVPSNLVELTFRHEDHKNRNFSMRNRMLQSILDEAQAGGVSIDEVAQKHGVQLYDFLWGKWIRGEGWLEPRQNPAEAGKIPLIPDLPEGEVGHCVHLSGLPPPTETEPGVTAQMLWNVLGMYGELVAVKILAKDPRTALIQYTNTAAAEFAIKNLNHAELFGGVLMAKGSTKANATHWRGAQTELEQKMVTIQDMPAPAVAPPNFVTPPSNCVAAWLDPSIDGITVMQNLFGNNIVEGPITIEPGVCAVAFATKEDAFMAVAMCNGYPLKEHDSPYPLSLLFVSSHYFLWATSDVGTTDYSLTPTMHPIDPFMIPTPPMQPLSYTPPPAPPMNCVRGGGYPSPQPYQYSRNGGGYHRHVYHR